MRLRSWTVICIAMPSIGCQCEQGLEDGTEATTGTSLATEALTGGASSSESSSGSSDASTGALFDPSRWIGRYHYQDPWLEFGERGDPLGPHMLLNFEIHADSTASMHYDDCAFDEPTVVAYEWTPGEPGWLDLHPGEGESSLRVMAGHDLDSVRIQLVEPCRALQFEIDGIIDHWLLLRPGASCWTDRCTTGNLMEVDYCEGEEPPPCP